jgi:hypothetical protein
MNDSDAAVDVEDDLQALEEIPRKQGLKAMSVTHDVVAAAAEAVNAGVDAADVDVAVVAGNVAAVPRW